MTVKCDFYDTCSVQPQPTWYVARQNAMHHFKIKPPLGKVARHAYEKGLRGQLDGPYPHLFNSSSA
jgi:hypothetical protein